MTTIMMGGWGGEGLSNKGKGLMDMDNSVVIIGEGVYKGTKWQWKKYNKNIRIFKKNQDSVVLCSTSLKTKTPLL